jgi:xanthine/uracil permease
MDAIKKYSGIAWILIGLAVGYFNVIIMGIPKFQSGKQEDLVFAIVNMFVLTPIIVGGLLIFGYYALIGEYNQHKNS